MRKVTKNGELNKNGLITEIETMIRDSLNYFSLKLKVEIQNSTTHRVIIVNGWSDNDEDIQNIAKYLVGLRAFAIDAALNIRAALVGDNERSSKIIVNNINSIIGKDNDSLNGKQKQDERNPWICEGIWHLCLNVAKNKLSIHPPGKIVALHPVHVNAKDHGLDGLAIYEKGSVFGISIVESKAYKLNPSLALSRATNFFKDVEDDKYSGEIFQAIQIIRPALTIEQQQKVSEMFWEETKTYIINPHYDSTVGYNLLNERKAFREFSVDKNDILIMPNIINNFDDFFDKIGNEMREIGGGL